MSRRHALLMLACCLVPAAGIAALVFFRVPLNAALWLVFALACPLIHLLGMRSMGHDHASHRSPAPASVSEALSNVALPPAAGTQGRPG